jgi:hypothetical protein
MFAWKSMDVNSNLVKLKLDMVYRDLSMETASVQYTAITRPVLLVTEEAPEPVEPPKEKPKPNKKVVKPALPKSK